MTRKKVPCFRLQKTKSFPDGAPQRESYDSDDHYFRAEKRYEEEWRAKYQCAGCVDPGCPQCGYLGAQSMIRHPRNPDDPKVAMDFPVEHREAFDNGYLWGQKSIVNTLLEDSKKETAEERAKYEGIMELLRDSRMKHGTCKPRSRKACTACNAQEILDKRIAQWRGPTIALSEV